MTRFVLDTARQRPTCRRRAPARSVARGAARSDTKYGRGNTPRTRSGGPLAPGSGQPVAAVVSNFACACDMPNRSRIADTTPSGPPPVSPVSPAARGALSWLSAGAYLGATPPGARNVSGPLSAVSPSSAANSKAFSSASTSAHEWKSSESEKHDIMSSSSTITVATGSSERFEIT